MITEFEASSHEELLKQVGEELQTILQETSHGNSLRELDELDAAENREDDRHFLQDLGTYYRHLRKVCKSNPDITTELLNHSDLDTAKVLGFNLLDLSDPHPNETFGERLKHFHKYGNPVTEEFLSMYNKILLYQVRFLNNPHFRSPDLTDTLPQIMTKEQAKSFLENAANVSFLQEDYEELDPNIDIYPSEVDPNDYVLFVKRCMFLEDLHSHRSTPKPWDP